MGEDERRWGIEMNDPRFLYLKTYGTIDRFDNLIGKCHISYRHRKYWHSAMLHGLALVVVVAYDMYCEAASGSLDPEWKVSKKMNFHQFRDRLSGQMLRYNPAKRAYPGDSKFRVATQQNKKKRIRNSGRYGKTGLLSAATIGSGGTFCLPKEEYTEAIESGRLCQNFTQLGTHLQSIFRNKSKSGRVCHWCGKTTYHVCTTCKVPLHHFPKFGSNADKSCSLNYHDLDCFGIRYMDSKLLPSKRGITWRLPSKTAKEANKRHIRDSILTDL